MILEDVRHAHDKIIVFGASGHAKVVIDVIEKQGLFQIQYLIDDNPGFKGERVYGYEVVGGKNEVDAGDGRRWVIAIGDNRARASVANWLNKKGFTLSDAVVHPSAQLARGVSVGSGTVLMASAVVNSDTSIGKNSIVNTSASIDHDCIIGDSVHVAPGVTVCGGVSVGDLTLIGAGSVIHPNVKIGKNVIVGAGSTVIKDIVDGCTVVGSPAKIPN